MFSNELQIKVTPDDHLDFEHMRLHLLETHRMYVSLSKENQELRNEIAYLRGEPAKRFMASNHFLNQRDPDYLRIKNMEETFFEAILEKEQLKILNQKLNIENLQLKKDNFKISKHLDQIVKMANDQKIQINFLMDLLKDFKFKVLSWLSLSENRDMSTSEEEVNKILKRFLVE